MHDGTYDVIAVHPELGGDGLGVRFVRVIKLGGDRHAEPVLDTIAERYATVPFLILPTEQDKHVAIFVNSDTWYYGEFLGSVSALILTARDLGAPLLN